MARRTWAEYNERKLQILRLFASRGPMGPQEVAVQVGLYPTRAMYTRLIRLARWGLLHRSWRSGRLVYSLSPKGQARIAWLEAHMPQTARRSQEPQELPTG